MEMKVIMRKALLLVLLSAGALGAQEAGSIRGQVKEQDGRSLAGVSVRAVQVQDESRKFEATSDEKGQYALTGLPPGSYLLSFEKQGYRTFKTRRLEVGEGETVRIRRAVELAPEQPPYAVLRGSVFTADGFSLPNASVVIERISEGRRFKRETTSRDGGEFAFRLPPEKANYRITASARGIEPASKEMEIDGDEVRQIALSLSRSKEK
jgi:hypothetical protein